MSGGAGTLHEVNLVRRGNPSSHKLYDCEVSRSLSESFGTSGESHTLGEDKGTTKRKCRKCKKQFDKFAIGNGWSHICQDCLISSGSILGRKNKISL